MTAKEIAESLSELKLRQAYLQGIKWGYLTIVEILAEQKILIAAGTAALVNVFAIATELVFAGLIDAQEMRKAREEEAGRRAVMRIAWQLETDWKKVLQIVESIKAQEKRIADDKYLEKIIAIHKIETLTRKEETEQQP